MKKHVADIQRRAASDNSVSLPPPYDTNRLERVLRATKIVRRLKQKLNETVTRSTRTKQRIVLKGDGTPDFRENR